MRSGHTEISSVSISKEMRALIDINHISVTEAFRRGVAIILCEKGVEPYNNPLNHSRLDKEKKFKLFTKLNEIELLLQEIKREVYLQDE